MLLGRWNCRRRLALTACFASVLAWPTLGAPDDDPEALAPGLISRFRADVTPPSGVEAVRLATDLSWDWGDGSPDARLPANGFRLAATGALLIQSPGRHRFFVRGDGAVVLRVNGAVASEGPAGGQSSTPLDLRPGFVPIRLEYRHDRGSSRVAVDWEGPGFAREPVPARLLYHDPAAAPPPDRFEEGRRLADRLGCANCHAVLDLPRHPAIGPPLVDTARATDPGWLAAWLKDPLAVRSDTRMPAFGRGLGDSDAADLAAFLADAGAKGPVASAEVRMAWNVAIAGKGRLLFRSVGCLGCHGLGEPPGAADRGAPDLAGIERKRGPESLAAYLEHPRAGKGKGRSQHRADLRLNAEESSHLAAYLVEGRNRPRQAAPAPGGDAGRGRALADRLRCASCHAVPRLEARRGAVPLRKGTRPDSGCLATEPPEGRRDVPRFALTDGERATLRAFVAGLPERPAPSGREARAHDAIRRLNCAGCHSRDGQGGRELAGRLAPLLAQDPALGGLKGTLTPPNLTAVGDKLRPEFLTAAVRGEAPTARPWLSARMPSFAFEPGEAEAVALAFRSHDRMPDGPEPQSSPAPARPDRTSHEAAARLIGQGGFGCLSCHVLAGRVPPGGEPETLGPDLALAHQRMTGRYFRRWVADPQRIIAGTPMPQFLKPIEGVPGSLDDQLAALWTLLGTDSLADVVSPAARATLRRDGDRPLVVRDMVRVPGLPDSPYTPRGLAVGLKNDASLLFDADRLTWLAAWRGGFVSRTKEGRLWEWRPEGARIWTAEKRLPPVVLVAADGTVLPPAEVRERFGTFRGIEFQGDGLTLSYRLAFPGERSVDVAETIRPVGRGWDRAIRVASAPPGFVPAVVEQPPGGASVGAGVREVSWPVGDDRVTLLWPVDAEARPTLPGAPRAVVSRLAPDGPTGFAGRVELRIGPAR